MNKKLLAKATAIAVTAALLIGGNGVMAAGGTSGAVQPNGTVSPCYVAIILTYNNLIVNSGGRLTCIGETAVQDNYIARVKMELQRYSGGSWSTIKTWDLTQVNDAYLEQDWYVASGYSYRLKLTHYSYNSNNVLLENYVKYSDTKNY